ncbi:MAG: hypothetical protein U9O86_06820 [Campylobacterota bacterium]|nr:hypothetical protein [Campylobacterota bacterium]
MKNVFMFTFTLFILNATLFAEDMVEYDYELDAYYSNVSAFIDLDKDHDITDASSQSELDLYSNLMLNSLNPNIFLVEAAVHPMSIFGLYFRKINEDLYSDATLQNFSLVKALTAGFEEPYSLSFFFGRMMVFKNTKDKFDNQRVGKNRAYIGYLVSVGDHTIKDNLVYFNRWLNFEYKLKGTREKQDRDLDWSFRVGYKANSNENFVDSVYIGARRSSIDYKESAWSRLYNSAFSAMIEASATTGKIINTELTVEKKFPISWVEKVSFGVEVGYLYTSDEKYRGVLKDDGVNNHQLILRPNLKF